MQSKQAELKLNVSENEREKTETPKANWNKMKQNES